MNKKVIGLMKDELGGKIMKQFAVLIAKICSYFTDNNDVDTKAKSTKKCVIKKVTFKDYKNCLEANLIGKKHLEKIKLT